MPNKFSDIYVTSRVIWAYKNVLYLSMWQNKMTVAASLGFHKSFHTILAAQSVEVEVEVEEGEEEEEEKEEEEEEEEEEKKTSLLRSNH